MTEATEIVRRNKGKSSENKPKGKIYLVSVIATTGKEIAWV